MMSPTLPQPPSPLEKVGPLGPEKTFNDQTFFHWIHLPQRTPFGLFCAVSANEALMRWQAVGAEASIHSAGMKTPPLPTRTPGCEKGRANSLRSLGFQTTQQITTLISKAPSACPVSHFNGCEALHSSHLNTL